MLFVGLIEGGEFGWVQIYIRIRSREDSTLDNIAKEKLDSNKYDDTYFNEKSLAFIYITTYDITGKLILIEVDKDIEKIEILK